MINLLPAEDKIKNKKNYLFQLFVVAGFAVAGLFLVADILLLPSFLPLFFEKNSLKRQIAILEQSSFLKQEKDLYGKLSAFNSKLSVFGKNQEGQAQTISFFIERILNEKPNGVSVKIIDYSDGAQKLIKFSGESISRDLFLEFKNNLEESGIFREVVSPVSNLLEERNIEFNLTLLL
jgi:hypothetical protein